MSLGSMTMIDSYDMPGNPYIPRAILVVGSSCYVLADAITSTVLLIYAIGSPETAAMTLTKTVTLLATGEYQYSNPPQYGGLFLQHAGGQILAACFRVIGFYPVVMDSKIIKLDLAGNIISTITLPSGDLLCGMVVG